MIRRPLKRFQGEQGSKRKTSLDMFLAEEDNVLSPAEQLPAEMFHQIFQNVDKKSLKNSREVCTTWRNAIDNNLKLFKSFTFTITDIKEFLGSHLASKVKSVRFTNALEGSTRQLKDFFIKIGSTVEEIYFNFGYEVGSLEEDDEKKRCARQKLMFSMMLKFCTKLSSLRITSDDDNYDFMEGCAKDPANIVGLSMIQNLWLPVKQECVNHARELVLSLSNLRSLTLNCDDVNNLWDEEFMQIFIIGTLLEHLKNYNGILKEIDLGNKVELDDDIVVKFVLSVGNMYPTTKVKCCVDLRDLLELEETEDTQVNQESCKGIEVGYFQFHGYFDEEDTTRVNFCSNLQSLELELCPNQIVSSNFGFIQHLKKLTCMKIVDNYGRLGEGGEIRLLYAEVFACGIPSLTTLDFVGDGIGTNSILFHLYFPNLTNLTIRKYSDVLNQDFIYNLTNLEHLKCLALEAIWDLTDKHLTNLYDFDFMENNLNHLRQLPAIAGVTSLRQIHVNKCPKLTNKCLKDGLALCDKLEEITLCSCGRFARSGFGLLQKARNFNVEDFTDSDGYCGKKFWLSGREYKVLKEHMQINSYGLD